MLKKLFIIALTIFVTSSVAFAGGGTVGQGVLAVEGSVLGLISGVTGTAPAEAGCKQHTALVQVLEGSIRWWVVPSGGDNPTETTGIKSNPGDTINLDSYFDVQNFRCIRDTGSQSGASVFFILGCER